MQRDIHPQMFSGSYTRQAHVGLSEGTFEEEYGRDGFFGPATQIYHKHAPTGWTRIEGPLRPRCVYLDNLAETQSGQRVLFLGNQAAQIWAWRLTQSMEHLLRNADGDEMLFVHQGSGRIMTELGMHPYSEGDYLLIPRGIGYQLHVESPTMLLVVEATGSRYMLPDRGIVGLHAVFDPAVLQVPVQQGCRATPNAAGEYEVHVKRRNEITRVFYAHDPTDIAGWKGDTTVFKMNWRDIRPITSHNYHIPPSAHTLFLSERFVICTFVPRPYESDPQCLRVPYFHRNIDYEEVLFYHQGNFMSRAHTRLGMATLHPTGIHHGPHPSALRNQHKLVMADEVAVMIDFRDAVDVAPIPPACENLDYVNSWKE